MSKVLDTKPPDHTGTDEIAVTEIDGVPVMIRLYLDLFTAKPVWVRIPYIRYEDL